MLQIPVSDIKASIVWYTKILGFKPTWEDDHGAIFRFPDGASPALYLIQTAKLTPLSFQNTTTSLENNIIDFYIPDLVGFHQFLIENDVFVSRKTIKPRDGFGFKDPDGNYFGAFNFD